MPRPLALIFACLTFAMMDVRSGDAGADESLQPVADYEHLALPLLEQYCLDCHSGDAPEAGLALHKIEGGERFQRDRESWRKVLQRVEAGDMPPADYDALTEVERKKLIGWIKARLEEFDCRGPQDPGWVTLRRLNRDQYRNTIRDLLAIDFEPTKTFPPDMLAYGFDNNADLLSLTPILLEKYLDAARSISRQAIPVPEQMTAFVRTIPPLKWEGGQAEIDGQRELWRNGSVEFVRNFTTPGVYWLRVRVTADQAGDEPVRMSLMDGGRPVTTVSVHATRMEPEVFAFAVEVPTGKRRLGVAFRNDYYDEQDQSDRNLHVQQFQLVGPAKKSLGGAPRAYRDWFSNAPSVADWRDESSWKPAVSTSLAKLATAAYRRQPSPEEIDRLVALVDSRRTAGDSYPLAMRMALQAMLVSPRFLFIGNVDAPPRQASNDQLGYAVDEYELAARLSYFLWSSTPDATLLQLASQGRLRTELPQQVKRMIDDHRSEQLSVNFTGQWLGTRLLADHHPDETQIKGFDDSLRWAMAREAELVFKEVLSKNLPIATLLDADFTYLNARLAQHYGIEGVEGDHTRRVVLSEFAPYPGVRGGVLTMAGVLAATSNPDRTSPVKRGQWVLSELLAAPPPAPPPDVGSLEEVVQQSDRPLSIREQMEIHREDPSCAVCHQSMDPIGLALENYDLVGRWRTEDDNGAVDASGELPTGEKMVGVADLRSILVARREAFRRCLAKKMLTYALGRGLEYYDECALRTISERTAADGDRMQTMVMEIVESTPFQQRRFATSGE